MSVVDLSNKPVNAAIPAKDTPLSILQELAEEISAETVSVTRLIVVVEGGNGFFTRSSQMTSAEAIALTSIGTRLSVDGAME